MAQNNPPKQPFRSADEPMFNNTKSSGLAQSLATNRTTLNTSRPVTIGRNVPTATVPTSSSTNSKLRPVAQSAPAASFVPPKPPTSRPKVPDMEPPMFDLPPSLPDTSFLESQLANMTVKEADNELSDEETQNNNLGGVAIAKNAIKPGSSVKPVAPSTMGRSLTNNTGYMMAMSGAGAPQVKSGDNKPSQDMSMGRSPTIFSIMSGIEDKIGTPVGGVSHNNAPVTHSSRASTTRPALPPMSAQPKFDAIDDEDEDEFGLDDEEDEDDDDLQFNLTLGA